MRPAASREPLASQRDAWLRLDDVALLRQCRQERYRASGPGGQRRNKVETAIRLHHGPSGLVAQAEDSRSPEENRRRALRRLRERIAIEVRAPFEAKLISPVFERYRRGKALAVNLKNPEYPQVLAVALDALEAAAGSYAEAAAALGVSTSQLLKLLQADSAAWRSLKEKA